MILWAGINGYCDDLPKDQVKPFERAFHKFMAANYPAVGQKVKTTRDLDAETEKQLKQGVEDFKKRFLAGEFTK
jgi:F-type H+-transporting ATPase subunit alpha